MQRIKDIKPKELVAGVTGYYAHGDKHTLGLVELKAGSVVPEHHHIQEQITYILEGQLDLTMDGKSFSLTPGAYNVIPSNTPHSAIAITDCKLIDTFSPVREDYKSADIAVGWNLQNQ